ncbi:S-Ena type endospore appendage [Paenibacillus sp. SYP-B4298]|uniref:S-Ena type endospore appendage n=1 Tax=Paenibacillus sp. SYP-B4298 TaxID=2996034 RepID=UPI0022DE3BB8|nr:S-Ena type endospore appendage [Paenibacillus sp. SYP-B4298]
MSNSTPHVYYLSSAPASGIVRVTNETKCTMRAIIEVTEGEAVEGVIEQGQQVSFDVPPIRRLSIVGSGEGGICKGRFVIRLRRAT